MPRKVIRLEARALGRLLYDERHRSTRERRCPDTTPPIDTSEDRPALDLRRIEPCSKTRNRTKRTGRNMHRHVGTFAELIRLAPRDVDDDALAMPCDVRNIERH